MKYLFFLIVLQLNFNSCCFNNSKHRTFAGNNSISKAWESQTYDWILSSLQIYQEELFFGGTDKHLYCVSLESGKVKWKFETQGECYFPPAFSIDKIFFTSFDLFLYALNYEGKEVWKYKLPERVKSSPVYHSGLIIISVINTGIIAIDAETGKQKWAISQDITDLSSTQPTVSNGVLLVGNLNKAFSAINPENGIPIWKNTFENMILSDPSVYDTITVFGGFNPIDSQKAFVNALNIKTGKEIWAKTPDYNARYRPLITEERIYVGTERSEILCLNIEDGEEVWRIKLEKGGIGSDIISFKNKLYLSSYERNFHIIDALTGKPITQTSYDYGVGNPLLNNGSVFFGTGKGILYKVRTE